MWLSGASPSSDNASRRASDVHAAEKAIAWASLFQLQERRGLLRGGDGSRQAAARGLLCCVGGVGGEWWWWWWCSADGRGLVGGIMEQRPGSSSSAWSGSHSARGLSLSVCLAAAAAAAAA